MIREVFIFPKENLNIHWRPGKSANEVSSIRGATWLNTVFYFIYKELIFQSRSLMWAFKKASMRGREKNLQGFPPYYKLLTDQFVILLEMYIGSSVRMQVTALDSRLKTTQINLSLLLITSCVAHGISVWDNSCWNENWKSAQPHTVSVFVNKISQDLFCLPKDKCHSTSLGHSPPPKSRWSCSCYISGIIPGPFFI